MGRGRSYDARHPTLSRGKSHHGFHTYYHHAPEPRRLDFTGFRDHQHYHGFEPPHRAPVREERHFPDRHHPIRDHPHDLFGIRSRQSRLHSDAEPRYPPMYSGSLHNRVRFSEERHHAPAYRGSPNDRSIHGISLHDRIESNPVPHPTPSYKGNLRHRLQLSSDAHRAPARSLPLETQPQGPPPRKSAEKRKPTCFFWYHGSCAAGTQCKQLHALTEPPTVVTPPPGYIHWDECNLRLCALRTRGAPEGLRVLDRAVRVGKAHGKPFRQQQLRSARRNGRRAESGRVAKKGSMDEDRAKRGKEASSAAARPLLTAANLVRDSPPSEDDSDGVARIGSASGSAAKVLPSNDEDTAEEWFLKGFD